LTNKNTQFVANMNKNCLKKAFLAHRTVYCIANIVYKFGFCAIWHPKKSVLAADDTTMLPHAPVSFDKKGTT